LAGAAALVWCDGNFPNVTTVGSRDLVSGLPVERDTLFRIASLTKPVTTVAALSMLDEGSFALDDPITGCAPELTHMRVLREPEGPLELCDSAVRSITFRDLLTHSSGLSYGDFHRGPIGEAYTNALGPQIDNPLSPDEWITSLATLPLIDQPGTGFHYGHSTDLLGFLLARLEGVSLGTVLERRVFAPLGMKDTGFSVPPAKHERRAGLCGFDSANQLAALPAVPGGHALAERPQGMQFESGGQVCGPQ
jgi:CubicO group peptidase (beta-lactamase class C family)